MLFSIAPTLFADINHSDYLFTQPGSNRDQEIPLDFTLIAMWKNSAEDIYIRDIDSRFWKIGRKLPQVDHNVNIEAKYMSKNYTLHIKNDCLSKVSGKIQEIIDHRILTKNILSLCDFFNLDPMTATVARKNLHHVHSGKREKSVPHFKVLEEEKLIASSNEAVIVFYCKSKEAFMPLCFKDTESPSSFKCADEIYHLMAYVSIDTTGTGDATHYVRFDKNNLKFESKDHHISPYTTLPHAPSVESKCYVWMYIAESCNDQIKMSSLENSVTYITQDFDPIVKRFPGTRPFTTANLVTVVLDDRGIVVKDPTPDSLIANTLDTPQIFVEIVNRSGKDRKYNYVENTHPDYFLMAILQQYTNKSRQGSNIVQKIWFRGKKEEEFINVPSCTGESSLQWSSVSKNIPSTGVVFVYRLDESR